MLLTADRVITPDAVLAPGWVALDGECVSGVGGGAPPAPADEHLTGTLVPGFVDLHCHGGGGASFTTGEAGAARAAAATHLAHGTTSVMASLVTDSLPGLCRAIADLAPLVTAGDLLGVHLEGPWLSPGHCGAHDPELLRAPTPADLDRLLAVAPGAVVMVTLAPELDGALAAIEQLAGAGVLAAIGHTDATFTTTVAALDAGARVGTHLFNAMRAIHHREPGPIVALLEDPRATVELIADGIHLRPEILAWAARSAAGGFLLVTDAMAAAAADDGDYHLGDLDVRVRDGVARLASTGAIAGSTLTLDAAVRFAVRQAGLPLADAVRAATLTPATLVGRSDLGAIRPGARADLVLLDDDLRVTSVHRRGRVVSSPHRPDRPAPAATAG